MKNYYKVSVFDRRLNKSKGGWVVKKCSIQTRKLAAEIVSSYFRDGYLARWSKHLGGDYHYEGD